MHHEFEFLKSFFHSNGFPRRMVEKQISLFLSKVYTQTCTTELKASTPMFLSIPYFGPQSEKLRHELIKVLEKYFPSLCFRIVLVNRNTISSMFRFKDSLPCSLRSSLVYSYSCSRCESQYVGETSRLLGMRIAEHMGTSYRTNIPLTVPPHSSIRDHANICNNSIDKNDFKILCSGSGFTDLRILESMYISKLKPTLNDTQSSYPLIIVR